jgi:hypothetical protein
MIFWGFLRFTSLGASLANIEYRIVISRETQRVRDLLSVRICRNTDIILRQGRFTYM